MTASPLKKIFLKSLLKFFRLTGTQRYFRIQRGFLKGKLFNVNVDNDIFYGNYETDAAEKIRSLATQYGPFVYYDVGAHYGFFSLLFSMLNAKEILAFEPYQPNYNILLNTLQLNHLKTVKTFNLAIANSGQASVSFSDSGVSTNNTFIDSAQLPADIKKQTVAAASIDELLEQQHYTPPSFIKIDVEGAEYELLLGALSTIKNYRPYILLATHDCHLPGVKEKCIALLKEQNYGIEKLNDKKAFEGLDDFLCIPAQ